MPTLRRFSPGPQFRQPVPQRPQSRPQPRPQPSAPSNPRGPGNGLPIKEVKMEGLPSGFPTGAPPIPNPAPTAPTGVSGGSGDVTVLPAAFGEQQEDINPYAMPMMINPQIAPFLSMAALRAILGNLGPQARRRLPGGMGNYYNPYV
jgi:hypothetical protein